MNRQRFPKLLRRFPALCGAFMLFLFFGTTSSFAYYAPLKEVFAWVEDTTVHFKVYDYNLNQWMKETWSDDSTIYDLQVIEGIVSWKNSSSLIFTTTYDPCRAIWKSYAVNCYRVQIKDGIAQFYNINWISFADETLCRAIYDPTLGSWVVDSSHTGANSSIINKGIVANQSYTIIFATVEFYLDTLLYVYLDKWEVWTDSVYCNYEVDPAVQFAAIDDGGTVTWAFAGVNYVRGFKKGGWYTGISQPVAYFTAPAVTNGPAWFTDMSVCGTSWHYDFGDGTSTDSRSPFHMYAAAGSYIVTQTVTSPNGSDTTTRTVIVDTKPPGRLPFLGLLLGD